MKAPKPKKPKLVKFRPKEPKVRGYNKLTRNQECPCCSGLKYKKCCGKYLK